MKKRFSALTAAVAVFASMACSLPASAEPYPSDLPAPEWIPQSFTEAMRFYKTYGATHAEEDVVCYVELDQDYPQNKYNTTMQFSVSDDITDSDPFVWEQTYTFEQPVPPADTANTAELDAYCHLCDLLGWPKFQTFEEGRYLPPFHFTVHAYKITPGTKLDVTTAARGAEFNTFLWSTTYSFEFDSEDGKIKETDIYGWLPDCEEEYEQFIVNNDTISVHGQYIVFAGDVAIDSGFEIHPYLTGTAYAAQRGDMFIEDPRIYPLDGSLTHKILLYEPTRPGLLETSFYIQRKNMGSSSQSISDKNYTKYFEIGDDLTIKEYDGEVKPSFPGDCNSDGNLSVADAVVLLKYLFGENQLTCWQNADLSNDGVITAADFTLLKQKLIAIQDDEAYRKIIGDLVTICFSRTEFSNLQKSPEFTAYAKLQYHESTAPNPVLVTGLSLYDAETDEKIADFTYTGDEHSDEWQCTISAVGIDDREFYAAGGFASPSGSGFEPVIVKSVTICPSPVEKRDYDIDPSDPRPFLAAVELKSEYTDYGLGKTKIKFSVTAEDLSPNYRFGKVTLCSENVKPICEMTPRTDALVWECELSREYTEECNETFFALVEYIPDGTDIITENIISNALTVHFAETPAP